MLGAKACVSDNLDKCYILITEKYSFSQIQIQGKILKVLTKSQVHVHAHTRMIGQGQIIKTKFSLAVANTSQLLDKIEQLIF